MRHLHSTKLQHLRKTTRKQTSDAPDNAVCAVAPIIGNDEVGSSILPRGTRFHCIFRKTQTDRSQHYATLSGTKRVSGTKKPRHGAD